MEPTRSLPAIEAVAPLLPRDSMLELSRRLPALTAPVLPQPTPAELATHAAADAAEFAAGPAPTAVDGAPQHDWEALVPRGVYASFGRPLLDAVLLLAALPAVFALGLPIALLNLLVFRDPRKVFFVQERIGHRGRPFRILKFRTMCEVNQGAFDSWSGAEEHLRVTAFGRILRNTHLDELPQLINVALGDMTFIGPRPEMREIEEWAEQEVPGFTSRLAVKPGITGWAQITQGYTGRCRDAYAEKLRANRYYIDRLSLSMDVEILMRTVVWMMRGKGWSWQDPDQA